MKPTMVGGSHKSLQDGPFCQGVSIYVGATGRPLCPVAGLLAYLVQCGVKKGPLFLFKNGQHLMRARFVVLVTCRSALQEVGITSERYSYHSFRIGAATVAFQCGTQDSLIQTLGQWQSSAYLIYIWTPPAALISVSKALLSHV